MAVRRLFRLGDPIRLRPPQPERQDADELVKLALIAMIHDRAGRAGEIDFVYESADRIGAQANRWKHLERCDGAMVVGPVTCTQDATGTGSGCETVTAPVSCPHGDPITARVGGWGHGYLLERMIRLGELERLWTEGDDDD